MTNIISAVILAAGLSLRMGSPKMLLPWGQTTVLGQVITTFGQAGVLEILIVTGGARQSVESEMDYHCSERYKLRSVYNPGFASGEMLSSLQCGLASLDPDVDAALVGLGDQPQLSLAAVSRVLGTSNDMITRIIVPSYNMRRGHPWLVHRKYWDEILELKSPMTIRDFLNAHTEEIFYVDADPSILKDLDTPDMYQHDKP